MCRRDGQRMNLFALLRKSLLRRLGKKERQSEERSFSFYPPLPLARELKVVRCDPCESHGCELRRSPGLAVAPAFSNQDRCGTFPRVAQRWSDWPQWPAHTLNPPYSRAAATASILAVPNRPGSPIRLPEHEVRGECDLQRAAAGLRLTKTN